MGDGGFCHYCKRTHNQCECPDDEQAATVRRVKTIDWKHYTEIIKERDALQLKVAQQDAEIAKLIQERDEAIALIPTEAPGPGVGNRLLLNAYGRLCYEAGRAAKVRL